MMKRIGFLGWCALFASAAMSHAQTPEIQKALDAALQKEREIQGKKSADKAIEIEFSLKPPVGKDGKPLSLGAILDRAVKNNSDIRLSEMKVREAEANLTKTRLVVMQQVVLAYQELEIARATFQITDSRFRDKKESTENFQKAKAELAKAEAQLAFLLGEQRRPATINLITDGSGVRVWDFNTGKEVQLRLEQDKLAEWQLQAAREAITSGSQTEKLSKSLNHLVRLKAMNLECNDVVEQIRDLMKGINLTVSGKLPAQTATVDFKEAVELGAILQWFEDEFNCRFVVRDYGVVLVNADRLPPGAVLVQTFWKAHKTNGGPDH